MPWRGIYSGLPIEFKIDDKDFLEQVYDQEIKFGNGTSITCNLQIETKTTIKDDIEEAKTYYIVKLITQWSDDEHFQYDTKKYKTSNPQLSSSASFLRLNVLSSLN